MAATAMVESQETIPEKPERDENGRLKPGGPPLNPRGFRGRRNELVEHWARELIEDPLNGHVILKQLLAIVKGKNKLAAVQAAKIIMEYAYGKPRQRVEIADPDGNSVQVIVIGNQRIEF